MPSARPDPAPPRAPATREFAALDGLRAVAVLMVFDVHYFDAFWRERYTLAEGSPLHAAFAVLHSGHLGVDLFFVLSGFVIHHTLTKREARFLPFMRRRYQRLLPAHLAVALPLLVASLAAGHVATALANALLVQSLLAGVKALSFVTWSLSYELAFYALAAAWVAGARRLRFIGSLPFCWMVVAACLAAHAAGLDRAGSLPLVVPPNLARFAGFVFGFGLSVLHRDRARFDRVEPLLRACLPLAIALVYALRYAFTRAPEPLRVAPRFECGFYALADLAFAVVAGGTLAARGALARALASRPLVWLGRRSYSFYLSHALYGIPLGAALAARLAGAAGRRAEMACGFGLGLAATSCLAAFLFEYLEAPYFRRAGRPSN